MNRMHGIIFAYEQRGELRAEKKASVFPSLRLRLQTMSARL